MEGGSNTRLWTVPKILVMFIVKFVRYDFRVCRVAVFLVVDVQTIFHA